MSFIAKNSQMRRVWLPVTASTALVKNTLVAMTSGLVVAATSSTAAADIIGVLDKTIATTDADYATSGRLVPVFIPIERFALFEADVTSGLVAADIGTEVDLTNSGTINRAASSIKAVRIVKVLSATKALCWVKFQGSY